MRYFLVLLIMILSTSAQAQSLLKEFKSYKDFYLKNSDNQSDIALSDTLIFYAYQVKSKDYNRKYHNFFEGPRFLEDVEKHWIGQSYYNLIFRKGEASVKEIIYKPVTSYSNEVSRSITSKALVYKYETDLISLSWGDQTAKYSVALSDQIQMPLKGQSKSISMPYFVLVKNDNNE